MAEVRRRPDPEVLITGHTDRVGGVAQNDALSLQRAERVRASMLDLGLPADRAQAVGRGEREPLVPTDDEVAEPRNRRVEITVR
jgi:outer membrane protein OmpA-like peptidoglycan-associated protein